MCKKLISNRPIPQAAEQHLRKQAFFAANELFRIWARQYGNDAAVEVDNIAAFANLGHVLDAASDIAKRCNLKRRAVLSLLVFETPRIDTLIRITNTLGCKLLLKLKQAEAADSQVIVECASPAEVITNLPLALRSLVGQTTIAALAADCDLSRGTVRDALVGLALPELCTVFRIAIAVGAIPLLRFTSLEQ